MYAVHRTLKSIGVQNVWLCECAFMCTLNAMLDLFLPLIVQIIVYAFAFTLCVFNVFAHTNLCTRDYTGQCVSLYFFLYSFFNNFVFYFFDLSFIRLFILFIKALALQSSSFQVFLIKKNKK